jgi:hypothetical protein
MFTYSSGQVQFVRLVLLFIFLPSGPIFHKNKFFTWIAPDCSILWLAVIKCRPNNPTPSTVPWPCRLSHSYLWKRTAPAHSWSLKSTFFHETGRVSVSLCNRVNGLMNPTWDERFVYLVQSYDAYPSRDQSVKGDQLYKCWESANRNWKPSFLS